MLGPDWRSAPVLLADGGIETRLLYEFRCEPEELDRLDHLDAEAAETFADAMRGLRRDYGLRVLGGCCGTNDRHIRAVARRLVAEAA